MIVPKKKPIRKKVKRFVVTAESRWGGRYVANGKPKTFRSRARAKAALKKMPMFIRRPRVVIYNPKVHQL